MRWTWIGFALFFTVSVLAVNVPVRDEVSVTSVRSFAPAPTKADTERTTALAPPRGFGVEVEWENAEERVLYTGDTVTLAVTVRNRDSLRGLDWVDIPFTVGSGLTPRFAGEVFSFTDILPAEYEARKTIPRLLGEDEEVVLSSFTAEGLEEQIENFSIQAYHSDTWRRREIGTQRFLYDFVLEDGRDRCVSFTEVDAELSTGGQITKAAPKELCVDGKSTDTVLEVKLGALQPTAPNTISANHTVHYFLEVTNTSGVIQDELSLNTPLLQTPSITYSQLSPETYLDGKWMRSDEFSLAPGKSRRFEWSAQLNDATPGSQYCQQARVELVGGLPHTSNDLCHLVGDNSPVTESTTLPPALPGKATLIPDDPLCSPELCLNCTYNAQHTLGNMPVYQPVNTAGELDERFTFSLKDPAGLDRAQLWMYRTVESGCAGGDSWQADILGVDIGGGVREHSVLELSRSQITALRTGQEVSIPVSHRFTPRLDDAFDSCRAQVTSFGVLMTTNTDGTSQRIPLSPLQSTAISGTCTDAGSLTFALQGALAGDRARPIIPDTHQVSTTIVRPYVGTQDGLTAGGSQNAMSRWIDLQQELLPTWQAEAVPAPFMVDIFPNTDESLWTWVPDESLVFYAGAELPLGGRYDFTAPTTIVLPFGHISVGQNVLMQGAPLGVLALEGDLWIDNRVEILEGVYAVNGEAKPTPASQRKVTPRPLYVQGNAWASDWAGVLGSRSYVGGVDGREPAIRLSADRSLIESPPPLFSTLSANAWGQR